MAERYYLDTAIWVDLMEDRSDFNNEPLGEYAWKLFALIKEKGHKIIISDLLMAELNIHYSVEQINGMIKPFENLIERRISNQNQEKEARIIAIKRNLPKADVLHAIIARDFNLILITRDKHFKQLDDIASCYKPEEIT